MKISLTAFSLSPTYLEKISGPFTAKKFNPLSVANALAINVLEHPGGPYNKVPFGGERPRRENVSGCFKGNSILWRIWFIIFLFPPISLHFTLGIESNIPERFIGFIIESVWDKDCNVSLFWRLEFNCNDKYVSLNNLWKSPGMKPWDFSVKVSISFSDKLLLKSFK